MTPVSEPKCRLSWCLEVASGLGSQPSTRFHCIPRDVYPVAQGERLAHVETCQRLVCLHGNILNAFQDTSCSRADGHIECRGLHTFEIANPLNPSSPQTGRKGRAALPQPLTRALLVVDNSVASSTD
eukprot:300293-Amphidinium_carterae.1